MSKKSLTLILVTAIMSFWAWAAAASTGPRAMQPPTLAEMGYVLPPFRFTEFCIKYPSECPSDGGVVRVHMTKGRMATLDAVNKRVNRAISPTADPVLTRSWALDVTQGDCNTYAVQKRHELLRQGWPAGALALAVVKTGWGEGHLVLTVRTDRGDFVLDNLRPAVLNWRKTGYAWIMRQSDQNPRFWVALNADRHDDLAPMMAATDAKAPKLIGSVVDRDVSVVASAISVPPISNESAFDHRAANASAAAVAPVADTRGQTISPSVYIKSATFVAPWKRPSWRELPFRQARQGLAIRPYIRQARRQPMWFANTRRFLAV